MSEQDPYVRFMSPVPPTIVEYLKDSPRPIQLDTSDLALLVQTLGTTFAALGEITASMAWQNNGDIEQASFYHNSSKEHLMEASSYLRDLLTALIVRGRPKDENG